MFQSHLESSYPYEGLNFFLVDSLCWFSFCHCEEENAWHLLFGSPFIGRWWLFLVAFDGSFDKSVECSGRFGGVIKDLVEESDSMVHVTQCYMVALLVGMEQTNFCWESLRASGLVGLHHCWDGMLPLIEDCLGSNVLVMFICLFLCVFVSCPVFVILLFLLWNTGFFVFF